MVKSLIIDPDEWHAATQTGPVPIRYGIVDGKMTWRNVIIHKTIDTSRREYHVDSYEIHTQEEEDDY